MYTLYLYILFPTAHHSGFFDADEDEEDDDDDIVTATVKSNTVRPVHSLSASGTVVPGRGFDDRPITPMKNTMVYDREHSSLDFKDGKIFSTLLF